MACFMSLHPCANIGILPFWFGHQCIILSVWVRILTRAYIMYNGNLLNLSELTVFDQPGSGFSLNLVNRYAVGEEKWQKQSLIGHT